MKPRHSLKLTDVDAFIFDMDGVITRTARLHARAWKEMFDGFLKRWDKGDSQPFDIDGDYKAHVDGKSRYDGVKSFLKARHINLPFGSEEDRPGDATVVGLGKRKNALFLEQLEQNGVEVYPRTLDFINSLKGRGLPVAVVSASKNCRRVLQAAGLSDLFDVRVDGMELQESGLEGKPAPDIFLRAARLLETDPHRTGVVEDALAGIEAASAGGFHPVIAVARDEGGFDWIHRGAHMVVTDLSELAIISPAEPPQQRMDALPSALENIDAIMARFEELDPVFFLDYDGTLTPIVDHPDQAVLSESMKTLISRLAGRRIVAVVSGRDLREVRRLVGLPNLYYAGSHGFEISEPGKDGVTHQKDDGFLEAIDEAEEQARKQGKRIPGLFLERKRFSLAVHYRQVREKHIPRVEGLVDRIVDGVAGLKRSEGKKVFEIRPDVDWDKGKALDWLLDIMELESAEVIPLYIGDDLTDEDAFRAIHDTGIGIVVGREARTTHALYQLDNPGEVRAFISRCLEVLMEESQ